MKFDNTRWKILAFKVGKNEVVLNTGLPTISDDFDYHLWGKKIHYGF